MAARSTVSIPDRPTMRSTRRLDAVRHRGIHEGVRPVPGRCMSRSAPLPPMRVSACPPARSVIVAVPADQQRVALAQRQQLVVAPAAVDRRVSPLGPERTSSYAPPVRAPAVSTRSTARSMLTTVLSPMVLDDHAFAAGGEVEVAGVKSLRVEAAGSRRLPRAGRRHRSPAAEVNPSPPPLRHRPVRQSSGSHRRRSRRG